MILQVVCMNGKHDFYENIIVSTNKIKIKPSKKTKNHKVDKIPSKILE